MEKTRSRFKECYTELRGPKRAFEHRAQPLEGARYSYLPKLFLLHTEHVSVKVREKNFVKKNQRDQSEIHFQELTSSKLGLEVLVTF